MLTEETPPKIPRTAETLGKTMDKKHVNAQKVPQITQLAFGVNSEVPYIN